MGIRMWEYSLGIAQEVIEPRRANRAGYWAGCRGHTVEMGVWNKICCSSSVCMSPLLLVHPARSLGARIVAMVFENSMKGV